MTTQLTDSARKKLIGSSNLWLTEPILRILFAASTSRKSRTVNFVLEFDQPVAGMGIWKNDEIVYSSDELVAESCKEAGLFLSFDTEENPVVQVRSGISLVSVENASENLRKEIIEPFGWNFDAVVQNQKDTWNELLGRIIIQTDDRLEEHPF